MAKGDKLPVVMGREKAVPGGVATLGADGILAESQRPTITAGDNITLKQEGSELEIGAVVPGKNLLINSDFRKPVNRNGKAEYTVRGYSIDRWFATQECILADGHLDIIGGFVQKLKNTDELNGKTLTFSALFSDGNLCSGSAVFNKNKMTYFYTDSSGLYLTYDTNWNGFQISNEQQKRFYPVAAFLEEGDHQTHFRQNADGQWEIIDPIDYDTQYLLCSQYSPITGEWVGSQHSNPNLLDNWYFVGGGSQLGGGKFPINQKGQTEYTSNGYTIDRWRLWESDGQLSIVDGGILLSEGRWLIQPIESGKLHAGITYTISVLSTGGINRLSLYVDDAHDYNFAGNGLLTSATFTVAQDADISVSRFSILGKTGSKIIAAKLELGPVQTLAHKEGDTWVLNDPPPDYALEMEKCQRYYRKYVTTVGYFFYPDSISIPINIADMRTTPTASCNTISLPGGTPMTIKNISTNEFTFPQAQVAELVTDLGTGVYITGLTLDANL